MFSLILQSSYLTLFFPLIQGDHRRRDRMVVGCTTTCAISGYHH